MRLRVEQAHRGVEPCDAEAPLRRSGRELLLTTSAGGVYCFELAAELEGSPIHLRYEDPNGFLSAAELELRAAPAPRALDLVLTTPPDLPLDTPVHVFEIDALPRPTRDDGAARLAAPWSAVSIELTLESPHGQRRRLGVAQLVPGERGRLELSATELGPPGPATLAARFAGDTTWASAEVLRRISKTARVHVDAPGALQLDEQALPAELPLAVRWTRGAVPTGSVEAFWHDRRIGAGPVTDGVGRLHLAPTDDLLAALRAAREDAGAGAPLTLRYVPNAPWWLPGPPTTVELTLAPPNPWSRLPWFAAAAALVTWVLVIWRRPGRKPLDGDKDRPRVPPGRATLDVLDEDAEGLAGQVLDAHTGAAIADAIVDALRPTLEQVRVIATTRTNADGVFHLEVDRGSPEFDGVNPRLRVRAPGYAPLERPLPRRGRLMIHLSGLRRAILDQLLSWARRKGPPWSGPLPPTPAHIADTAEARSEEATARWAKQVEEAAFGPIAPDEDVERHLREAEPP